MATCQEIIERALLRGGDTDAVGRTKVEMLSDLNHLARNIYEDIITWKVGDVEGFRPSTQTLTVSSNLAAKPSDLKTVQELRYDTDYRLTYVPRPTWESIEGQYIWTDYDSSNFGIKPDDIDSITLYYYPTLSTLNLSSDFPGGGTLDNLAELYLLYVIAKADRDDDLDFRAAWGDYNLELKRMRQTLWTREGRARRVKVLTWPRNST